MKHIHELLAGKRVGIISAHPDDHLIQGHAIHSAHKAGAYVRELTLTKGKKSTVNHTPDPYFVLKGQRQTEGVAAAQYMGVLSNDHLNGTDGNLEHELTEHVPIVAEWAVDYNIDLLLSLGGLIDHADHVASAAVARKAAARLWDEDAYAIEILEVQQYGTGAWRAQACQESQATIFGAAHLHASQMLVANSVQPGWEQVPGDLWVHPDTLQSLDQYPLRRSAAYKRIAPAMAGAAIIAEQAANPQ